MIYMEIDLEIFNKPKILIKEVETDKLIKVIKPKREFLWKVAGDVLVQITEYNNKLKGETNENS